jgi:hypothetical protein
MAVTCTLINKVILSSNQTVVSFTGLGSYSSDYTDLLIKVSARGTGSGSRQNLNITLNSNTSNYNWRGLYGYGSTIGTNSTTNRFVGNIPNSGQTANVFSTLEIYIPNFSSSDNKSISTDYAVENNGTDNFMGFDNTLWSNTAAITQVDLQIHSSGDFVSGSTFYLYGIKKN